MPDLTFETLLSGQLREYAEAGVRPIDRFAIAEETIAGGRTMPRWRRAWGLAPMRGSRVLIPLLVGLLLVALVGGALLVGSRLVLPKPPTLPGSGYDAIFLRAVSEAPGADVDIVAVRADGEERLVKRLTASILPDGRNFSTDGSVSQDGWIAVATQIASTSGGDAWALIDLADPTRAPRLVPYAPVIGGAWGPRGLFATEHVIPPSEVGTIDVVDAATGETRTLPGLHLPGMGPDLIWAADGSGLLVVGPNDTAELRDYAVAQIDGSPAVAGVPALAPRLQERWVAPGGLSMDFCLTACLTLPDGTASISGPEGVTEYSAGDLAPARLVYASFAADGRSVWLLLDRMEGSKHVAVVAHADSPNDVKVVGTADLGEDVALMWFRGLAPDDSTIAIGHWTGTLGGGTTVAPVTLMRTSDTTSSAHSGNLVGFVPAPVTDAWPREGDGNAALDPATP